MSENLDIYTYKTIQHNEIRLCKFLKETDHISATFATFSINELPPYQTLSYVWSEDGKPAYVWSEDGKPAPSTWEIVVDGCRLPILESLRPFFNVMKDKGLLLDGTWWWIDSMCINQNDNEERNDQVKLMRRLYSNCRACVVWLGTVNDNRDEVVEYIHYLEDQFEEEEYDIEALRSKLRGKEFDPLWDLFLIFLSAKWWNRIWTLQEFICPPSITFFYGNRVINRSAVCRAILIADEFAPFRVLASTSYRHAWNRRRIWLRHINLDDVPPRYAGLTLPALAAYCCTSDATKDVDRLYGLHGLVTVDQELLRLDYSQSVDHSYRQYTTAFITKHHSLDLCIYASIFPASQTSTLPSWVPDWRTSNGQGHMVLPLMVSQSGNPRLGNMRPIWSLEDERRVVCYNACSDREAVHKIEENVLSVSGVAFDLVGSSKSVSNEIEPIPDSTVPPVPTNLKEILISVCRCLALDRQDRYLRFRMPEDTFLNDFLNLFKDCLTKPETADNKFLYWFNKTRQLRLYGQSLEDIVKQYLHQVGDIPPRTVALHRNDTLFSFRGRFLDTTKHMEMRMVVTKENRLAMIPRMAQPDDIVCILYGCSVPVLLRKVPGIEDSFTLVGECYVDGMMSGEALHIGCEDKFFRLQ